MSKQANNSNIEPKIPDAPAPNIGVQQQQPQATAVQGNIESYAQLAQKAKEDASGVKNGADFIAMYQKIEDGLFAGNPKVDYNDYREFVESVGAFAISSVEKCEQQKRADEVKRNANIKYEHWKLSSGSAQKDKTYPVVIKVLKVIEANMNGCSRDCLTASSIAGSKFSKHISDLKVKGCMTFMVPKAPADLHCQLMYKAVEFSDARIVCQRTIAAISLIKNLDKLNHLKWINAGEVIVGDIKSNLGQYVLTETGEAWRKSVPAPQPGVSPLASKTLEDLYNAAYPIDVMKLYFTRDMRQGAGDNNPALRDARPAKIQIIRHMMMQVVQLLKTEEQTLALHNANLDDARKATNPFVISYRKHMTVLSASIRSIKNGSEGGRKGPNTSRGEKAPMMVSATANTTVQSTTTGPPADL